MYSAVVFILVALTSGIAPYAERAAVFNEIDAAVAAGEYYEASALLGRMLNELHAAKIGFAVGREHDEIWRRGRDNPDLAGSVRLARDAWRQADGGSLSWRTVMDRLTEASASASQHHSDLPAAVRYRQARTRYEHRPRDFNLLQQVSVASYEAGEWDAALSFIEQERAIAPKALQDWHGGFLHQRETTAGLIHLEKGDADAALRCLEAAGENLLQIKRANHYFTSPPEMSLAQTLLERGHRAQVLRYIGICIEVRQPRGGMCETGEPTFETLLEDIAAGRQPRFPR